MQVRFLPRTPEKTSMRILHFSDIHFWRLFPGWDFYYPKRFLGLSNLLLSRRRHFPKDLAESVMRSICEQEADYVLFSGDLTTMSLESEFRDAASAFAPLYDKWGENLVLIPGNHDRYSPRSVRSGFYEKYFPRGFPGPGKRIFSKRLDTNLSLIGFDASRPFMVRSNGLFDEALEKDLDSEFIVHKESSDRIILMGHFPYAYPSEQPPRWNHKLLRDEALSELISRHEPIAYIHGHKHVRWCVKDSRTPKTICLNAGPAGMRSGSPDKRAGWVTFDVSEEGKISEITKVHLSSDGELLSEALTEEEDSNA
ncbi:MAG TPA: metallophosphoesterase [Verrucomicrobiales bacterium]|nr:metallophosphoesterase [Verrucomicrobiales bacterium]